MVRPGTPLWFGAEPAIGNVTLIMIETMPFAASIVIILLADIHRDLVLFYICQSVLTEGGSNRSASRVAFRHRQSVHRRAEQLLHGTYRTARL